MLFNSMTFLFVFLPLLLIIYFIIKPKHKNKVLLVFSILFYAWGEPKFIFLVLISIIINHFLALKIEKNRSTKKYLILSLILNLGVLFIFKYLNFIFEIVCGIINVENFQLNLRLPIGISFYTFQLTSYMVDVYRGKTEASKNIFDLATYLLFFPQLIAGPIIRYNDMANELKQRTVVFSNVVDGLRRFVIGLAKKVLLANTIANIVDTIFMPGYEIDCFSFTFGILAFALQIYYDFGGYSDMAIGLGKIFGFDFKENFSYPYISLSVREFWHRWHMSLATWLRDYIYIPLGGNRCSKFKWVRNIFVVWMFSGLWHGSSYQLLAWALYLWVVTIFEKIFSSKLEKLPKIIRWFYTAILILICFVIFRVGNPLDYVFVNRSFMDFVRHYYYLFNYIPFVIVGCIFIFPIYPMIEKKFKENVIFNYLKDIVLVLLFIVSIMFIISNDYTPFIYFKF